MCWEAVDQLLCENVKISELSITDNRIHCRKSRIQKNSRTEQDSRGPHFSSENNVKKRRHMAAQNSANSAWLRRMSLVALVVQNVSLILVMRYVRVRAGDMFVSSTAVVMSEVSKLCACCIFIFYQEGGLRPFATFIYSNTIGDVVDCAKMSVPSIVYVLQNNLLYLAVSNLDAATFQVSYQVKLLTTALFAWLILRKVITKVQWFSLLLLFIGVGVTQLQPASYTTKSVGTPQNPLLGLIAVIVACFFSGFAGIYFEKILKGTEKSLWWRNVQLAFLGIIFGLTTVVLNDGAAVRAKGFFFGYDWLVAFVILLQSLGGLLVAVVVKYADNILKGFATSAAIVLSAVISIFIFGFRLSWQFVTGAALVILASVMYNSFGASATPVAPSSESQQKTDAKDAV